MKETRCLLVAAVVEAKCSQHHPVSIWVRVNLRVRLLSAIMIDS